MWIEEIYETRDPQLLLRAPLCTSANVETPTVKLPMVVGEELLVPAPKPSADAPVAKDKDEVDDEPPSDLCHPVKCSLCWSGRVASQRKKGDVSLVGLSSHM